ncbi:MAG TPA: hypothetical protein VHU88_04055 [Sporichthyaceae bacterium]|jgi:hypothetical protein|nr:hypothetical protein [Sporichthyaceae bacterium]
MNARRVSTIVSTTLIGLALAGGGAITAPSAGAATVPAVVASGSPTPSGGTPSDPQQAPKAGDQKPAETTPVKHAGAHSKGKRAKTTRVSTRTRSHRAGKAVARHRKPMAPAGASSSTGAPMAG